MSHGSPPRLPSKDAPFSLLTDFGYRFSLTSLEAVFEKLDRSRVFVDLAGPEPVLIVPPMGWRAHGMNDLRLVDAEGQPVDLCWLGRLLQRYEATAHERRACQPGFRRDPVKGVSKWRGGRRMFRHPRTTAMLRQVAGREIEDLEPDFRGRTKNLPTAWDDQFARPEHSWKNHRRQQWRS